MKKALLSYGPLAGQFLNDSSLPDEICFAVKEGEVEPQVNPLSVKHRYTANGQIIEFDSYHVRHYTYIGTY